jgi:hypothetical protein
MLKISSGSNSAGLGESDFRTTVYLSGRSMLVNQLLAFTKKPEPTLGSRTWRKFHFTSSLVNSRPVWNWTPLRRLSLICVRSALRSQLSASIGCGFKLMSF